ncbi:MAG: MMPL family transporter [Candidatus Acetothermia bacterium]|jgi:predicted RND superfamily exporter protein|nr:MMPL family transporter [Candidatus Acetothermia bacterium]
MTSPFGPHPEKSPNKAERRGLRARVLGGIVSITGRWAAVVAVLVAALVGAALYYIQDLPIRSSYIDLLPERDPLVERFQEVQEELATTDVVAVLLTLTAPPASLEERARILFAAADRVIAELDDPEIIGASYRLGQGIPVPPELLLFRTLSPEELSRLRDIAQEVLALLPALPPGGVPSVAELLSAVASGAITDADAVEKALHELAQAGWSTVALLEDLPRVQGLLDEAAGIVRAVKARPLPEDTGQPILSRDHTRLIVQIWPARSAYEGLDYNHRITRSVRDAVARADLGAVGVTAGVTGPYVTSVEVDQVIRRDMNLVTIISSTAVFVLILIAFTSPFLCVVALVPVLVSALLTMAWAKFAVGGFNLLTAFLPALVLGLGIDFSVHLLARYAEERVLGSSVGAALATAIRSKGEACIIAAVTTSAVFACLLVSNSRALWEMGVIMTVGIVIALVIGLLVTPSLVTLTYAVFRRQFRERPPLPSVRLRHAYHRLLLQRRGVVVVGLLITGALVYQASHVHFRFVSAQLAPPTSAQDVLTTITREFAGEIWLGDTFRFFCARPEDIKPLEAKLAAHPLVESTASVRDLLPQELLRGQVSLQDVPLAAAHQAVGTLQENLERWDAILADVEILLSRLSQFELLAALSGQTRLAGVLAQGTDELVRVWRSMRGVDRASVQKTVAELAADLAVLASFVAAIEALPPEPELVVRLLSLLPEDIRAQYSTAKAQYVVEARMKRTLYEGRNLQEFLDWTGTLGVEYFGLPELQARLERYMKRDFALSTILAVVLILIFIWRDFPRPSEALLAMAPLAMGYVWMLAGMRLLRIEFNFTNIVISPLLIGIGVDSAVHLLHRVEEERRQGGDAVARGAATSMAPILTSSLTTMAAFGALLAAHTPGLRLLGTSALLGLGFTLLGSLLFVPAGAAWLVEETRPRE